MPVWINAYGPVPTSVHVATKRYAAIQGAKGQKETCCRVDLPWVSWQ